MKWTLVVLIVVAAFVSAELMRVLFNFPADPRTFMITFTLIKVIELDLKAAP